MTASPMPLEGPAGVPSEEPAPAPVPQTDEPDEEKRRRRRALFLLFLLGLLAGLILLTIWYLLFRQPIPLPVIPDAKVPGYSTSLYGVSGPVGIAVTPAGDRIYVAQSSGDRDVAILDGGGTKIGTMDPPAEAGTDHQPVYVAIDPLTTEVYVTDRPTGEIYIYDSNGRYQRTFKTAQPIPGWQPMGMAFDKAGFLYVTDLSGAAASIEVFDRTATLVRTLGENDELSFPNGIALDDVGNVYVSDSNNGRVLVYDTTGKIVSRIGRGAAAGTLGLPRGTALDDRGRLFVVDTSGQSVAVYRRPAPDQSKPEYLGSMGAQGVGDAQFQFPNGVATDGRGRVYVADTMNDRVQVWSY